MSTTNYDSRTADKFVVRLPEGLRSQIEVAANASDRSMNGLIVQALKQYLDAQNRQELLLNALASAVSVENDRANQISETGESANHPSDTPVVSRARSLITSLMVCGDMRINEARQFLNALASTARTTEDSSVVAQSMHIDDRVKKIAAEPAFLTVVFKLPSLSEARPLIAQFPYGQKALGTEAVVFGLSTGNLLEGDV